MKHSTDDNPPTSDTSLTEDVAKKRAEMVRKYLYQGLEADLVEVDDQSHLHAGHPGAAAGGSHFEVIVVAKAFEELATRNAGRVFEQMEFE